MTSSNTQRRGLAGRARTGMVLHIPGPISADQGSDSDHHQDRAPDSSRQAPGDLSSQCLPPLTLQALRHDHRDTRGPMTPPLRHRQLALCVTKEDRSRTDDGNGVFVKNGADNDVGNGLCVKSEQSDVAVVGSKDSGQCEDSKDTVGKTSGSVEKHPEDSAVSAENTNAAPVIKRKPSLKKRPPVNSSTDHVFESGDPKSSSEQLLNSSQMSDASSGRSPSPNTLSATDAAAPEPSTASQRRRISFAADSVLTAVIQDGDTAELLRILTGRHGPGLVQSRGEEGGVRGVDVCQTNHVGLTALHQAVLANNLDAAKLLLCHGAEVNAQDVHGFSPLHTAAACGSLPLTSLLLLFGADVFSVTLEQELAVDVAKDLHIVRLLSLEMVRLLQREFWVSAALRAHAEEVWLMVRKLLAWVVLFFLHLVLCVRTAWGKHRKSD